MLVLPLAALIGSAVGYVAYRQIPSPIIPLNAHGVAQSVLVSWPPTETRNATYAAIRVDDSAPVPLSPGEKATGQLELSATPDMKIELITHNWLRNSRGIVRFVKADTPAQTTPALSRSHRERSLYALVSSDSPFIWTGCSKPKIWSSVGAISFNAPCCRKPTSSFVRNRNGTGFVV